MVRASREDRALVIDLLVQSFDGNPSVNSIVGAGKGRGRRMRRLMGYSFDRCLAAGVVYLHESKTACALVLLTGMKPGLASRLADLKLALGCIGLRRLRYVLRREKAVKACYPKTPFHYLWFIGVLPATQGQGAGTRLLQEVCAAAAGDNCPVLLETSVLQNVRWYLDQGFRHYAQLDFGYRLYFLRYG